MTTALILSLLEEPANSPSSRRQALVAAAPVVRPVAQARSSSRSSRTARAASARATRGGALPSSGTGHPAGGRARVLRFA